MAEPERPTQEATTPMVGVVPKFDGSELPSDLWGDLRRAFEPRYQLRGILGRGGMGIVVDAYDPVLERPLAIKILIPDALREDSTARERLLREARAAATLSHPNVVSVFAVGETPTLHAPYILMQQVQGETLERKDAGAPPVDVPTAMRILGDVAEALTVAHARGLIHRDLKPSNVIVDGQTGRAVVLDFGISAFSPTPGRQEAKLTGTGMYLGTPLYMSPEQAMGEPATAKSDIYSLGCLVYELLAGRRVFDGDSAMAVMAAHIKDNPMPLAALRPDLPPALAEAVTECLAKSPALRPSADDLRRRCAPLPAHHPWASAGARGLAIRLRVLGLVGVCAGVFLAIEVLFLSGASGAFSTQAAIGAAFSAVATITYLVVLDRSWGRLALDGSRWVVPVLAGERSRDVRAIVERRLEFASTDPSVAARELLWAKVLGVALLAAGPLTMLLAGAVIIWPPGDPGRALGVLLFVPVGLWLALEMLAWFRQARESRGFLLHKRRGSDTDALATLREWTVRERASFGRPLAASGRNAIRVVMAMIACVGLFAGFWLLLMRFLGSAQPVWTYSNTRMKYEAARPLLAAAIYPPQVHFGQAADSAWSAVIGPFVDGGLSGRGPLSAGAPPPEWSGSKWLENAMHAAFRGLSQPQRQYLRSVAVREDVTMLRRALRSGPSPHWQRVADRFRRSSDQTWWDAPIPKFSGGKEAIGSLAVEAILLVDSGRRDSAEVLLREGLGFAGRLEGGGHTLIETLIGSVEAAILGPVLGALYEETGQNRAREALSPLTALPTASDLEGLVDGLTAGMGDQTTASDIRLRDSTNSLGDRWEMLSYQRRLSCQRARALWTGEDPTVDSAVAYARRSMARDAADTVLVEAIGRELSVLGKRSISDPDMHGTVYELLRRLALTLGKEALAGCLVLSAEN